MVCFECVCVCEGRKEVGVNPSLPETWWCHCENTLCSTSHTHTLLKHTLNFTYTLNFTCTLLISCRHTAHSHNIPYILSTRPVCVCLCFTCTVRLALMCSWWRRSHCPLCWNCKAITSSVAASLCGSSVTSNGRWCEFACVYMCVCVTFSILLWCLCSLSRSVGRATLVNLWIGPSRRLSVSLPPSSDILPDFWPRVGSHTCNHTHLLLLLSYLEDRREEVYIQTSACHTKPRDLFHSNTHEHTDIHTSL